MKHKVVTLCIVTVSFVRRQHFFKSCAKWKWIMIGPSSTRVRMWKSLRLDLLYSRTASGSGHEPLQNIFFVKKKNHINCCARDILKHGPTQLVPCKRNFECSIFFCVGQNLKTVTSNTSEGPHTQKFHKKDHFTGLRTVEGVALWNFNSTVGQCLQGRK